MKLSTLRPKDRAFEEFLRYVLHDGDGIIRIKPNGFLAGWELVGPDAFGTSWSALGLQADAVARIFSTLDERWTIHITSHHYRGGSYPASHHAPNQTVFFLDQARKQRFDRDGHHFFTTQRLWISWQPFVQKNHFINAFVGEPVSASAERETFLRTIRHIESLLTPHFRSFTRLDFEEASINSDTVIVDRIVEKLGQEIYGNFGMVASDPEMPMFLSYLLASPVDLQPHLRVGGKYINVLSPRVYPRSIYPAMLDSLQYLPYEYRYAVRLVPYSPIDGKKKLGQISRQHQLGALGIGMLFNRGGSGQEETPARWRQDAKDAQAHIDEGASYCSVLPHIAVYGSSPEEAALATEEISKTLQRIGMLALLEEPRNRFFAFLATLPGECDANELRYARMPLHGATRIMPLTSTWHGPAHHPDARFRDNDEPLLMLSTAQREPFRLYLHVLERGHALLVGPTGTGKSVLLRAFENAHLARYLGARVLSFDIGKSAYKFTRAINGRHYLLGLGDGPQLAPLTGLLEEENFEDIFSWIVTFVELWRPQTPVTIEESKDLRKALQDLRHLPKRHLSSLAQHLQIPSLREVFMQTDHSLLDAHEDHISFDRAQVPYWCFEIGQLGVENHRWTIPTMLYLQRRAFAEFAAGDARPTMVTLDESARAFKIPRVEEFAERLEREGRKNRVQFLFACQTPQEIIDSNIRNVLISSTATKIALHNAEADNGFVRQSFLEIGFSEEDCYTIARMEPFQALVKNEHGVQLLELHPTPLELSLFGGACEDDCQRIDTYTEKYGETEWLPKYLEDFGLPGTQQYPAMLRPPSPLAIGEAA